VPFRTLASWPSTKPTTTHDGRIAAASFTHPGPTTLSPTSPKSGSSAGPSSVASSTNTSGPHRSRGQDWWPSSGTSQAPVLGADADLLQAAAWLHDIGYAPVLAVTGLHALDGARYLRDAQHANAMLCRLVAHHSCAIIEPGERGPADALSLESEPAPHALSSALTYCDMTTGPGRQARPGRNAARRNTAALRPRAPGEPVNPARHADDPPRSPGGPRPGHPKHIAPQTGTGVIPHDLDPGWNRVQLAPGMAPTACSISSNYLFELEPRYGIEP